MLRCLTSGENVHETNSEVNLLFLTGLMFQNGRNSIPDPLLSIPQAASEKHDDEVKMFSKEEDNTPTKDRFTTLSPTLKAHLLADFGSRVFHPEFGVPECET